LGGRTRAWGVGVKPVVGIARAPVQVWEKSDVEVRRDQSSLRFIMPLAFPELKGQGYRFEQRAEQLALSGRWQLLGGEKHGLLAHVRIHFNSVRYHSSHVPGRCEGPGESAINPALAFGYIFTDAGLSELPLPGLGFSFRVPGRPNVHADITGVQIGIFRLGVGFVSLEIKPRSGALPDWLDALHYLRFYRSRGERLQSNESEADVASLRIENFLGPVLAAVTLDGERSPFADKYDGTGRPQGLRIKELYTRGELLTYVTLFADGVPEDSQRHLLYTVVNRYRSASQATPAEGDDDQFWCLPYQEGQQFLNSIEGSAFVAFDSGQTQFDLDTLPSHLRTTYFTLFLLALLQRFALDQLSEAVALSTGRVLTGSERGHARGELMRITDLDSRLLDFTGRCYFVQVSQTAHHHGYYTHLREVNEIEGRYREVTEEIHALRAHAASRVGVEQERTSLRVGAALMVITCVLLPLQVIESLFSAKLAELPGIRILSPGWSAVTAGIVLLLALAAALLILNGGRRKRRRGDESTP